MTRRVQAFCKHGGEGACDACVTKLLDERDALRAVLHDAVEEQGLTPTLQQVALKLVTTLRGLDRSQALGLGGAFADHGPLGQAKRDVQAALALLFPLVGTLMAHEGTLTALLSSVLPEAQRPSPLAALAALGPPEVWAAADRVMQAARLQQTPCRVCSKHGCHDVRHALPPGP